MTATAAAGGGSPARWTPTERQAVAIVGIAHLVLLAALSLALRSVTPSASAEEAVAIEIVADAPAGAPPPAAVRAPTPVEPAASPETTPPPAPSQPVEKPAPEPQPDKAEPPKPAKPIEQPEPEKPHSRPEKARTEKPKPDKPKPERLDADALSTLLDKRLPKPRAKPLDTTALAKSLDAALPKGKPLDTAALSKSLDAALPKGAARAAHGDPRAAAALAAAIRAQVTPCWNLPVGAASAGKVTALLHLDINRDGTIAGRPGLVSQTGVTGANADYARAFAETARRAVLRCAPLKLPADSYDQWKAVEINFDPTNM